MRGNSAGGAFEGIRLWSDTVSGNKVIGNTIINADNPTKGRGAITVYSSAAPSYNLSISGNIIDQCGGDGIYLYNVHDSLISDNIMNIPVGRDRFS